MDKDLVCEININDTRWTIFKQPNGLYGYTYSEFYPTCGIWRDIFTETDYTKETIECEFDAFDLHIGE